MNGVQYSLGTLETLGTNLNRIAARVGYELFLVTLVICRNTTDINKKLGNKEVTKKEEEQ